MSMFAENFPLLAMIPLIIEDQLIEAEVGAAEAVEDAGRTPDSRRSASSRETFS